MINKMILQGRLTFDPVIKQSESGASYCKLNVAWSEKKGEKETKLFQNCITFNKTAEFVSKYFSKGKMIIVEGKLSTDEYTNKDGNKAYSTNLLVDAVHFCGEKASESTNTSVAAKEIDANEDLPF